MNKQQISEEYDRLEYFKKVTGKIQSSLQRKKEIVDFMDYATDYFIETNKDKFLFMEIGLAYGANFVLMGNVMSWQSKEVFGIGLDLPTPQQWAGTGKDVTIAIPEHQPTFQHRLIIGNSHKPEIMEKVDKTLGMDKLDMLFIDGDHTEQGCRKDWRMYRDCVHPGGLIIFHDIKNKRGSKFRVWRIWETIRNKFQTKEISHARPDGKVGCGLGVLIWESKYA
jgi:cephalosporin hydroxylase